MAIKKILVVDDDAAPRRSPSFSEQYRRPGHDREEVSSTPAARSIW
jgi:hypothetical protein